MHESLANLYLSFNSWHPLHRVKTHKFPLGLIMYPQIIQILAKYLKTLIKQNNKHLITE